MRSPAAVLKSRRGHCFEMATLVASFLIGVGYNAFVVSGYGSRELCTNDCSRRVCPFLKPQSRRKTPRSHGLDSSKYKMPGPPNLKSKFWARIAREERKLKDEARELVMKKKREKRKEREKPPPDELGPWRVHSWVVVLPAKRHVAEPFFLDPPSGFRFSVRHPEFHGIESVWNDKNYYINIQSTPMPTSWDIYDINNWEHLLLGEPLKSRTVKKNADISSSDEILLEKHLDMPLSWVENLYVPTEDFETRFEGKTKVTKYNKMLCEMFTPYYNTDGLVRRFTEYADYEQTDPLYVFEYYQHREDRLVSKSHDLRLDELVEVFDRGREDCLKFHRSFVGDPYPDGYRTMEFFWQGRIDGLKMVQVQNALMEVKYDGRDDFLIYQMVDYGVKLDVTIAHSNTPRRAILCVLDNYSRNPKIAASASVAMREFEIEGNEISINYHYEDFSMSNQTRMIHKPSLEQLGDDLEFNPQWVSGYFIDRLAKQNKGIETKLQKYYAMDEALKAEEKALNNIRAVEDQISLVLRERHREIALPELTISKYHRKKNEEAKKKMLLKKKKELEELQRRLSPTYDILVPYLHLLWDEPGSNEPISFENATLIHNLCLNDFIESQLNRANRMVAQYEKVCEEIHTQKKQFMKEIEEKSTSSVDKFLEICNNKLRNMAKRASCIKLKIIRHAGLSYQRYLQLKQKLLDDPRLIEYYTNELRTKGSIEIEQGQCRSSDESLSVEDL